MLGAMATPGSPADWSEEDIDKGWDELEPAVTPGPVSTAASTAVVPAPQAAPTHARPKRSAKSKEERAAKAARKAAKQEARRAERRIASTQNQKRPAPRATVAVVAAQGNGAAPRRDAGTAKAKSGVVPRTPSAFSHRRSLLIAGVVACVLVLGGLVWFLGWRTGGTLTLQ